MRAMVIASLLFIWLYVGYRVFQRGQPVLAVILVVVGLALTAFRVARR